jgi:hypothetical protein
MQSEFCLLQPQRQQQSKQQAAMDVWMYGCQPCDMQWLRHAMAAPAPRRLWHTATPPPRPVPKQPGPRAAAASTCCSHAREKWQTSRWLGEEAESGASPEWTEATS